ncbi:MAG: hypothetical protein AMJ78_01270 [Omnitrophica WOR_2 bacterium SM23_29]|nr:MAG: hypothetical protein AMJ78_01270 [Omnitrophica WOR_2 bacterium SM23_29]
MSLLNPQKQQELFDEFIIREKRKARFFGAFKFKKPLFPQHKLNMSVSYEALIIVLIGLVLTISIIFSLGVERGRNLEFAKVSDKGEQTAAETKAKESPAQPTERPVEVQKQPEIKPQEGQVEKAIPAPSEEEPFTIQVASFRTLALAEKELSRLENIGYSSDVLKKGNFFIVCVGNYSKKELAQQTLSDLRRVYVDCYIRRR